MKKGKKLISLLLCAAMLFSLMPMMAFAEGVDEKLPQATVTHQTDEELEASIAALGLTDGALTLDLSGLPKYGDISFIPVASMLPDVGYQFVANTEETENDYDDWYADFSVSFDKPVVKDSLGLIGQYPSFPIAVGFFAPLAIPENYAVPLLNSIAPNDWRYSAIRAQVGVFNCGAFNLSPENIGTTMTVDLRLFDPKSETLDIQDSSTWVSYYPGTGMEYTDDINSIVICSIPYTFDKVNYVKDAVCTDDTKNLYYAGIANNIIPEGYYYLDNNQFNLAPEGGVNVSTTVAGQAMAYFMSEQPVAEINNNGSITRYATIADAIAAATTKGDVVKLLKDTADNVTVAAAQDITLDLNGHVLIPANVSARVITNNGTLTLTDTSVGTSYKFAADANGKWVIDSNGTFEVKSGYITGAKGAIENNGTFTMNGGALVGNEELQNKGSAITNNTGTCTIEKGIISGNTALNQLGDIITNKAELNISGGEISYNKVSSYNEHSIICNYANAEINFSNGKITFNTHNDSLNQGGAIFIKGANSVVNMSGGELSENSSNDGGAVFMYGAKDAHAQFNLSGGTISNNHGNSGVAVYVGGNAEFNMSNGTVSNNKSSGSDRGAISSEAGTSFINISGGVITGNTRGVVNGGPTTISGGEIYGNTANLLKNGGTLSISGGYFGTEPTASYIVEGYKAVETPVTDEHQTNCPYMIGIDESSDLWAAKIVKADGSKTFYTTLAAAVAAVPTNGASATEIVLLNDITVNEKLSIGDGKNIKLNLNGKTLETGATNDLFSIENAKMELAGNGLVKLNSNYPGGEYKGIELTGSATDVSDYTKLTVGKDVTIKGGNTYGASVKNNSGHGYGVVVDIYGRIETNYGFTVNGQIVDKTGNVPHITVYKDAYLGGPYGAGYAIWDVYGTIEGPDSGFAFKAGKLNVYDGAYIHCTGPDGRPTEGHYSGINASGAAIQIESNNGYASDIEINISGGTITSDNGVAVLEYTVGDGTGTKVKTISISGGKFKSKAATDFDVSESFGNTFTKFITGGYYTSDVTAYVADGYMCFTLPTSDAEYANGYRYLVAPAVTRTYNANGGDGTMDSDFAPQDYAWVLAKNVFTRVGYDFIGWALTKGGGVEYTDEAEVTLTTPQDFYAVWKEYKVQPTAETVGEKADVQETERIDIKEANKANFEFGSDATDETKSEVVAALNNIGVNGDESLQEFADENVTELIKDANSDTEMTREKAVEILTEKSISTDGELITTIVEPYLTKEVTGYKVSEDGKEVTVDINAFYNVIVTTNPNNMIIEGEGKNTVVYQEGVKLNTLGTDIVIDIDLKDEGIKFDPKLPLYVKHTHGNATYLYDATLTDNGVKIHFTNGHGFSEFVFTQTLGSYVAKIGDVPYESLSAAVEAVNEGETILLLAKSNDNITVSKSISFTLDTNEKEFSGSISEGEGFKLTTSADGNKTTYTVEKLSTYEFVVDTKAAMKVNAEDATASVTLKAKDTYDVGYEHVLIKVKMTEKPDGSNPQILATDTEGQEWNLAQTGQWGPDSGFEVRENYSATTPLTLKFDKAGTYTATFKLIDLDNGNKVLCTGSKTIEVSKTEVTISAEADGFTYGTAGTGYKNVSVTGDNVTGYTVDTSKLDVTYYKETATAGEYETTGSSEVPTDAGNYKVVLSVPTNDVYTGSKEITFTIAKADITPTVSITGWTYDESASTPSVTGNFGNGEVTYEYKVKGALDVTYSADVPTNAGEYTVKATVAETANYKGDTATADFTIAKADYNATKTADGTLKPASGRYVVITLPEIPDGTSYGTPVKDNSTDKYKLSAISGNTITVTSTGIPYGVGKMTFTVPVIPDSNHNGYDIIVTVSVDPYECVGKTVIAPKNGTFKVSGGKTYTFTKVTGGWTIAPKSGSPISGPAGTVWTYANGVFTQTVTESISRGWTILNILFGRLKVTNTYYLNANGDYSTEFSSFTIYESYLEPEHSPAYKAIDSTHHKIYCSRCGENVVLDSSKACEFKDGHCIYCNNQDASSISYVDMTVKTHSSNFLFFKLYTADIYVSSDIIGVKSVKYSTDENGLDYKTGTKVISTRPISTLIIVVEATDGLHAYKYNGKTGTVTNYDLLH